MLWGTMPYGMNGWVETTMSSDNYATFYAASNYVRPYLQPAPVLPPAALARLHLSRAYPPAIVPTRAALRPRCALLTLYPHRTIVARGTVSWTRQSGRRPLRCRSCR